MAKYITEKSEDYSLLDKHTGEVLDYVYTKKLTIDEFIMVFFTSFPEIFKLEGVELKVLMCCWKKSTYDASYVEDGNVIYNNQYFKQYCVEMGATPSKAVVDNAISKLCKKGFLIKKCKGMYVLNPDYFFRGTLSNRSRLRLNIEKQPSLVNEDDYPEYGNVVNIR